MIPDGYLARWRGREYEASPDGALVRLYTDRPEPGFERVRPDRYRRLVSAGETEWLGYTQTVGLCRGAPVLVLGAREGRFLVEYIGGRAPQAASLGLVRMDVAVYRGWVDRGEVTAVRQERVIGP